MAFDTLACARRLKQAGMPEAQAASVAEATRAAIAAAATRADIARLEAAIKAEFADVRHEIENVRQEIAAPRTERKSITAAVDALVLRMTIW